MMGRKIKRGKNMILTRKKKKKEELKKEEENMTKINKNDRWRC